MDKYTAKSIDIIMEVHAEIEKRLGRGEIDLPPHNAVALLVVATMLDRVAAEIKER